MKEDKVELRCKGCISSRGDYAGAQKVKQNALIVKSLAEHFSIG